MGKKSTIILIIAITVVLAGYIILDMTGRKPGNEVTSDGTEQPEVVDQWAVSNVLEPGLGKLSAVSNSASGRVYVGGDSFVAAYTPDLQHIWTLSTGKPVTALSSPGDTVYASTLETILVISGDGRLISEWGPFEDEAIITSVTSNENYVAFADAGNRLVIVLDKAGSLRKLVGNTGEAFIIPSPHFDVALTEDDLLFVTNPGNSRVEKRNLEGTIIWQFGDPGIKPGEFSGCCNPSNFALIPGGFVTAEKGINRLEIIDSDGEFREMVSSDNNFRPSIPLDVASNDGSIIYAVNPADSKLYVFNRK